MAKSDTIDKVLSPNKEQTIALGDAIREIRRDKKRILLDKDIANVYDNLAREYNNAEPFKTTEEVVYAYGSVLASVMQEVEAVVYKKDKITVDIKAIFEREHGAYPDKIDPDSVKLVNTALGSSEWKAWYRKASMIFHPDQGGSVEDFLMLKSIDEMYRSALDERETREARAKWSEDFESWKSHYGYKTTWYRNDIDRDDLHPNHVGEDND